MPLVNSILFTNQNVLKIANKLKCLECFFFCPSRRGGIPLLVRFSLNGMFWMLRETTMGPTRPFSSQTKYLSIRGRDYSNFIPIITLRSNLGRFSRQFLPKLQTTRLALYSNKGSFKYYVAHLRGGGSLKQETLTVLKNFSFDLLAFFIISIY